MEVISMLGSTGSLFGGLLYLDDTDVQFVAGRCLVRYDTETRIQTIIQSSHTAAGITAVAVTPNKRTVAFAEKAHDGSSSVHTVEWSSKKKRRLTCVDTPASGVVSLSFTADGKTLLVQSAAPESSLRLVAWEKGAGGKVLGVISCVPPHPGRPVTAVNACPSDSSLIAASGKGFLRLFRFVEGAFKTLAVNLKRDPTTITTEFTTQLWLTEDKHVAGASTGELFLLHGSELVRMVEPPVAEGPHVVRGTGGLRPITALASYSKGFLVGCAGGVVRVYERQDDTAVPYRCSRSFVLHSGAAGTVDSSDVTCLSLSPNEEDLAAVTRAGQVYAVKFVAVEMARGNLEEIVTTAVRPLLGPFHSVPAGAATESAATSNSAASVIAAATGKNRGFADIPAAEQGVTGLSICLRKPLFATVGADKTVRVWNYSGSYLGHAGITPGAHGEAPVLTHAAGVESGAHYDATPVLELVQHFDELPTAVALHPSGSLIAVGLATCMRLCTLVLGHSPPALRSLKDYPIWQASDMAFSNGGGLLAAAAGTTITVLSPWTGATVATLRGHGDKVVAMVWSRDDRCLVSTARDGSVIRWAIVVPNAASGGGTGLAALQSIAGGPLHLDGPGHDGHDAGGRRSSLSAPAPPAPSLVGTVLARADLKDFTPLSLTLCAGDSGRDVMLAGVVLSASPNSSLSGVKGLSGPSGGAQGPTYIPVLRHIVLDASTSAPPVGGKEGVKIAEGGAKDGDGSRDEKADGKLLEPLRAIAVLLNAKLLVAGVGRPTQPPSLPPASGAAAAESAADAGLASPTKRAQSMAGTTRSVSPSRADVRGAASDVATASAPAALQPGVEKVGNVRLMRLPPAPGEVAAKQAKDSGHLVDVPCHTAPVLKLAVSRDEKLVISAAADGTLALWRVLDPTSAERPGAAAPVDRLPPSDTILVPKADMDVIRRELQSLETKLQHVTVENRKTERQKATSNSSRITELHQKFEEEIEVAHHKTAELVVSKSRMEQLSEGQIATLSTSQARELSDVETVYSSKLAAELSRYDRLVAERDRAAADAKKAAEALAAKQALEMEGLRAENEAALAEEEAHVAALEAERAVIGASSVKAADSIEHDVEGEMSSLRTRFEVRVAAENKTTLLLRGENGFLKRKFVGINREISEQKEEMAALGEKEKELNDAIANLTKDVAGHKKEIREREETIVDKDSRIYELKKKNQELEKFKFVLNYKIQELKRQIMPRKKEISDMREQLKEMELELLQYHKSNAALDLMIGELKLKRDGIQRDVSVMDAGVTRCEGDLSRIARDLVAVAGAGSSHGAPGSSAALKALRSAMVQLYAKYIHDEEGGMRSAMSELGATLRAGAGDGKEAVVPAGVNVEELADELARQRHHLERNVESITRKIAAGEAAAATDKNRLLRENTALTQEINDLRRDLRYCQAELAGAKGAVGAELLGSSVAPHGHEESKGSTAASGAAARQGASLRRTGALQGVLSTATSGLGTAAPMGIVVSVSKHLTTGGV